MPQVVGLLLSEETCLLKYLLKVVKLLSSGDEIRNLLSLDLDFKAGLFPLKIATLKEEWNFSRWWAGRCSKQRNRSSKVWM